MSTRKAGTNALVEKLKADVEAELVKVVGDDPALVSKIEAAIEKIADVAIDDLLDGIKNPLVRSVVRIVLHRTLDAGLTEI